MTTLFPGLIRSILQRILKHLAVPAPQSLKAAGKEIWYLVEEFSKLHK